MSPAVRRTAGAARRRVVRLVRRVTGAGVRRPEARCTFFAVLDGAALNLHAELPPATPAGAAEVTFVKGDRELRAPARSVAGGVEATVPLGDGPGEVPLTNGAWLVGLTVAGRRLALGAPDAPDGSGPTVASPLHPRSGRHYAAGAGPHDRCQLAVSGPKARAEVTRLVLGPTAAEIHGRLVGREAPAGGTAVFVAREGGDTVEAPLAVDDGRFRLRVPVADLAGGPDGVERIWDVWLRPAGGSRLRLGRFLHDVRDPRAVFRVDRVTVALDGDRFAGVRPYYTPAGNLAVALLPFTRHGGDRG